MLDVLEKYARDNGYAVVMDVSNPNPVLRELQRTSPSH
jgi:hypothetical protein